MKGYSVLVAVLLVLALLLGCASKPAEAPVSPPGTGVLPSTETPTPSVPTATSTIAQTPTITQTPTSTPAPSIATIVWTTPSEPVALTVDEAAKRATYKSGGTQVSGFFYKPQGTGPFPAVLLLHGKSGLIDALRTRAASLATQGYVAFAPDYFTPIGMTPEKFDASFYTTSIDSSREVIGNGLEALKSMSYVNPKCLGVMGFSLGGYFAFITASRPDVKGIVSYYGAYAPTLLAPRYPLADIVSQIKVPVLMLHGDKDTLVPIAQADTTRDLLRSKGKEYEYIVYPGVGHGFDIQGSTNYNASATADAEQKALAFFTAKLQ